MPSISAAVRWTGRSVFAMLFTGALIWIATTAHTQTRDPGQIASVVDSIAATGIAKGHLAGMSVAVDQRAGPRAGVAERS